MATFADTLRDMDELFYSVFPHGRKQPQLDDHAFVYTDSGDYKYTPASDLHYEYDTSFHYSFSPSSSTLVAPVPGPSDPGPSTIPPPAGSLEQLREYQAPYDPALDPIRTPPLQHAYYIPTHDELVLPGPSSGVYQQQQQQQQQRRQHSLHALTPLRRPSYPQAQSPVEAFSSAGLFTIPPDTPSDYSAASPRSENEDFADAIVRQSFLHHPVRSPPAGEPHHILAGPSRAVSPSPGRGRGRQRHQPEYPAHHPRPARALTHPHPYPHSHSHSHSHSQHSHSHPHDASSRPARGLSWDPHPRDGAAVSEETDVPPPLPLSPLPSKRILEKKPPLACLFCRGRKIACGPPLPGSDDKTCNQCQRRSLRCEYPSESRRGMRKKKAANNSEPPTVPSSSNTAGDSKDFAGASEKTTDNSTPIVPSATS